MSSEMANFWRQELTLNDARVSWLDGYISTLRGQYLTAAAGELRDAIQRELDDGLAELERVQARSHRLRSNLSLRVLNKFPTEIFRQIFLDVTILPETEEPSSMWVEGPCGQRASAPFVLAAVCSRWRQLSLQIPHLWAYIYLPLHPARCVLPKESCDLVRLLIARSQRVPLDILLPWSSDNERNWQPGGATAEGRTLALLTAESRRWRSIEFAMALGTLSVASMSFLRCVTPALERCEITGPWPDQSLPWAENFPNFLPVCPSLRYFRSEWSNIVPMLRPRDGPYPSLSVLTLRVSIPCSELWHILRRAAPSLQELELGFSQDPTDSDHVIRTPITFPRLAELRYSARAGDMFCANGTMLSFPVLRTLEIRNAGLAQSRRLREKTSLNIQELILYDTTLSESDTAELPFFTRINRLVLEECSFSDRFFGELISPRADGTWILPALEVVVLGEGTFVDPEGHDGENLIRLIQARRDANRSGGSKPPPSLRIVVDENAHVPSWVTDQIRFIMESDKV